MTSPLSPPVTPPVIALLPTYEEEVASTSDSGDFGPEPDIELRVPEEGWDEVLELDYIEEVQK